MKYLFVVVLYLTEYVDEFAIKMLGEYEGKKFVNVSSKEVDLESEDEKKELEALNDKNKDMFESMKEILTDSVNKVKFTNRLKNHPVCLTTEGEISLEMEKVMNAMPTDNKVKANTILEINKEHPIVKKLQNVYKKDKDEFKKYTKILYAQAKLIEGMAIDNPTEISNLVCELLSK